MLEVTDIVAGIVSILDIVHQAVQQFDVRFILRALRSIPALRKKLAASGKGYDVLASVRESRTNQAEESGKSLNNIKKGKQDYGPILPEEEIYLAVLQQV